MNTRQNHRGGERIRRLETERDTLADEVARLEQRIAREKKSLSASWYRLRFPSTQKYLKIEAAPLGVLLGSAVVTSVAQGTLAAMVRFIDGGDGWYRVQDRASGLFLESPDADEISAGTPKSSSDLERMRFRLADAERDSKVLVSKHTGLVLKAHPSSHRLSMGPLHDALACSTGLIELERVSLISGLDIELAAKLRALDETLESLRPYYETAVTLEMPKVEPEHEEVDPGEIRWRGRLPKDVWSVWDIPVLSW